VIECDPKPRADVAKMAVSGVPPDRVPVPRSVVPSMNDTEPVGVPVVLLMTVAVKVTGAPDIDGLGLAVRLVDVEAWFTVWVMAGDVDVEKVVLPL